MSWVDKELKRRAARAPRAQPTTTLGVTEPAPSSAERIAALWQRFVSANEALPAELKLRADAQPPGAPRASGGPSTRAWLHASNGAALGCFDDGIRYVWPQPGKKRSHNFWIRWKAPAGYVLLQRVGASVAGPRLVERRFDEARVDRIVKGLVTGRRVKFGAVRKKRFWLF